METIDLNSEQSNIVVSREELLIFNAALNEICNGIDIFEFESRIGVGKERVVKLLKVIGYLLDKMDAKQE